MFAPATPAIKVYYSVNSKKILKVVNATAILVHSIQTTIILNLDLHKITTSFTSFSYQASETIVEQDLKRKFTT